MTWLLVAALAAQAAPAQRTLEHGTQSYVDSGKQIVARTPAEWDAAWKGHAPNRPEPAVNFDREMVVGVFLGSRNTAGYAVEITGTQVEQGALVVRYRETIPPRAAVLAQIVTSPYHLVAVPTSQGPVRFENIE
jgi:hypothetical protein